MSEYSYGQSRKNTASQASAGSYSQLSKDMQNNAIAYNRRHNQSICRQIQKVVGVSQDGSFGPQTVNAIARWQATHGLCIDGKFGPSSKAAAGITDSASGQSAKPGQSANTGGRLTTQEENDAIAFNKKHNQSICRQIQKIVGVSQDGSFGPATVNAIAAWQAKHGLSADGQFGPQSKKAAGLSGAGSPSASGGRLTDKQEADAIAFNKKHNQSICRKIQKLVGVSQDGSFGPATVNAIADWQAKNGLAVDGQFGPASKNLSGIRSDAGSGGSGVSGKDGANPTDRQRQLGKDALSAAVSFFLRANSEGWTYSQAQRNQTGHYDCSYFTAQAWVKAGIGRMNTNSVGQASACYNAGGEISTSNLIAGDLLFYKSNWDSGERWRGINHVAIYDGAGGRYDAGGTPIKHIGWNSSNLVMAGRPSIQ